MPYIELDDLKAQLNIELAFTDDDTYLEQLIGVAELAISNYCDGGLDEFTDADMPITVKQSGLLLASHLYLNRGMVSFAQGYLIPHSFHFLLDPYKNPCVS